MDNVELIQKFGSWVRVQVAFYDFIFLYALEMCPGHTNEAMIQGFADGKGPYEDAVKAIEGAFKSFDDAWQAFRHSNNLTKGDNMLPGNNLEDNWYMAHDPNPMFNLKDLLDSFDNFDTSFKIQNEEGKPIYIRMSGKAGVIIIDSFKD